jgi:hypothetical protein
MTVEEAVELIREAVAGFADAGVPWERSRIGIFGFWVGDSALDQLETALQRALHSESTWAVQHRDTSNPYTCIVKFISIGGKLIRWENGILDMQLPDGGMFGVPEHTLRHSPRNA